VVFEHITTSDAAQFVTEAPANVGATITAHHLLYNRNHMLVGGIRPHFYCLPILKRNTHQVALLDAATSGNPKFFLGTDSAPRPARQGSRLRLRWLLHRLRRHRAVCRSVRTA
jgi:dihydroorotase